MKESNRIIAAVLVGAAVGGAIAWFLTSNKKDDWIGELKETVDKVKNDFNEVIDKGSKIVEEILDNDVDEASNKNQ